MPESRRSTRVPLKLTITIERGAESQTCDAETIVVSLHGALIATAVELSMGLKISIHVYLTDKRSAARVVYVDPKNPLHCGIELEKPRNIWGMAFAAPVIVENSSSRVLLEKQMECRTKDELEQHLSDVRSLATSRALTSEEKEAAIRAERFAIGLLREHDESGHHGKRCPFATMVE